MTPNRIKMPNNSSSIDIFNTGLIEAKISNEKPGIGKSQKFAVLLLVSLRSSFPSFPIAAVLRSSSYLLIALQFYRSTHVAECKVRLGECLFR